MKVYVGIVTPAPDSPPRYPRIEKVFARESDAQAWRIEGPPATSNSPIRSYEEHDVCAATNSHPQP